MAPKTTPTAPTFASVAIAEIPESAKRPANSETKALGSAILAAMTDGNAAVDPTIFADRKEATKRAAVLRRAVAAADPTTKVGTRIYPGDAPDTFRIAVMHRAPDAEDDAPARGVDVAE